MATILPSPGIVRREHFGDLLNIRGLEGSAVEVGTHCAEFAEALLLRWRGRKLHCVDPWIILDDYNDCVNHRDRNADYDTACARLAQFGDRVEIIRDLSANAVKRFHANELDFVYIDGNHRADHVRHDIKEWGFRVKSGGIIAGHDFNGDWEKEVRPEVERVANHLNVPVYVIQGDAASWMIIKP